MCLKPKFKYTDGLTPIEIRDYLRKFEKANYFFENDLEKQDR